MVIQRDRKDNKNFADVFNGGYQSTFRCHSRQEEYKWSRILLEFLPFVTNNPYHALMLFAGNLALALLISATS